MKTSLVIIISFIIGFLISFTISLLVSQDVKPEITGQVIAEPKYTYTTAICNDQNECIDVLVECSSGKVASLTPTSKLHEFGPEWEDFREEREIFCE